MKQKNEKYKEALEILKSPGYGGDKMNKVFELKLLPLKVWDELELQLSEKAIEEAKREGYKRDFDFLERAIYAKRHMGREEYDKNFDEIFDGLMSVMSPWKDKLTILKDALHPNSDISIYALWRDAERFAVEEAKKGSKEDFWSLFKKRKEWQRNRLIEICENET